MPISDFQSQFSMSKIIRIFLNFFLIEEYQFRGIFVVIDIFWKLQFLNHFVTKIMPIFQSPPAKRTLICQKINLWKSAIFHSIKPPFDAKVAEKFLNGIYWTSRLSSFVGGQQFGWLADGMCLQLLLHHKLLPLHCASSVTSMLTHK